MLLCILGDLVSEIETFGFVLSRVLSGKRVILTLLVLLVV